MTPPILALHVANNAAAKPFSCIHVGDVARHGSASTASYRRGFAIGGFRALMVLKHRLAVDYHRVLDHLAVEYLKADNVVTLQGIVQ